MSALWRFGVAACLASFIAGTALAQTPAQRLATWGQAVMRRQIGQENAAQAADVAQLEAQIRNDERTPVVTPDNFRCWPNCGHGTH